MISDGVSFILHEQLHHHFIVAVHFRLLCKPPNTLRAWSAQVAASASGWVANLGEAGARWPASPWLCYTSFWLSVVARGAAATGSGNGESG
jgi:hypothetical protein